MMGNYHVRFLGGKGAAMPPTYPILSKTESLNALNAVMEIITEEMKQNKQIILIGFGTFSVKKKAARKGMNPTTFAPIEIPAKKVVNFKPSIYLNNTLNQRKRRRIGKADNNI